MQCCDGNTQVNLTLTLSRMKYLYYFTQTFVDADEYHNLYFKRKDLIPVVLVVVLLDSPVITDVYKFY